MRYCLRMGVMKAKKILRFTADTLMIILGAAVYSLGIHCFISPNDIAPGGVTGIAIILTEYLPIQIGTLLLILNIPLIILGFILLNKQTMFKTLISVAAVTVFTDLAEMFVPVYSADVGNGIMAAIFGGAFMGVGMGFTYRFEGTSGGTDILTKIIRRFMPEFRLGGIQAALDIVVVSLGFLVYRSINVVLYAAVAIFVQTKCIDVLVYGAQECRFILIFSGNSQKIAEKLIQQRRGVTLLRGQGAYSGRELTVIATAVHRSAYSKVKRTALEIDPNAFIVTTTAGEVLGEGFARIV